MRCERIQHMTKIGEFEWNFRTSMKLYEWRKNSMRKKRFVFNDFRFVFTIYSARFIENADIQSQKYFSLSSFSTDTRCHEIHMFVIFAWRAYIIHFVIYRELATVFGHIFFLVSCINTQTAPGFGRCTSASFCAKFLFSVHALFLFI